MPQRIEDKELLAPALEAHKDLFGDYPHVLSTDKGFYESMKQILALEEKIVVVSIAKKGRRTPEEYARETTEEFLEGQRLGWIPNRVDLDSFTCAINTRME